MGRLQSDMNKLNQHRKAAYQTDKMLADARGRGWNDRELIHRARERAFDAGLAVPDVTSFYDFLNGKTYSPKVARTLAVALERDLTEYVADTSTPKRKRVAA